MFTLFLKCPDAASTSDIYVIMIFGKKNSVRKTDNVIAVMSIPSFRTGIPSQLRKKRLPADLEIVNFT